MQIKRLRKVLSGRGIEISNYYIDGTGKRDQFTGISFKLYGEIYKIFYNRNLADYTNKSFYQFNFNRELKKKLKYNIKEGEVDAFLLW